MSGPITREELAALAARFPQGAEQYRVGPTWGRDGQPRMGKPLPYIDARAVAARLDAVFAGEWSSDVERLEAGVYLCRLTVRGVTRTDCGQASRDDAEKEKAGVSDAFKRAAVLFGVGRYLYDMDLPPVQLADAGGGKWILPRGYSPPAGAVLASAVRDERRASEGTTGDSGAPSRAPQAPQNNDPGFKPVSREEWATIRKLRESQGVPRAVFAQRVEGLLGRRCPDLIGGISDAEGGALWEALGLVRGEIPSEAME